MRIAHIIPHSISFPLKSHNGRYEWVQQLAQLQASQGHEVTIYGGPDSFLEGVTCIHISTLLNDKRTNNIETFRLAFSHNHDLYHSHFDALHYEVARETVKPIVATQHWWPSPDTILLAKNNPGNVWAVPPTVFMYEFDRSSHIQSKGHIYHGIDLTVFKPETQEKKDRLLFVGRISPEKNLEIAIAAAQKAGVVLDIVGKISPKNRTYWESLEHYIDGDRIRYLGQKTRTELVTLYSSVRGVLVPLEATEAFGLVAIEAQACGAPVIMKRGGSRSELIKENSTGFLCDSITEFTQAIHQLNSLKPLDCITFASSFDIHTMTTEYENLYAELIQHQ